MGKKIKEYNIGLDIGTNSVGWCVTDNTNQVLKFRGKRMLGVRLFEEGQSAALTRLKRGQRRRYIRRKERIRLLQELIGDMVRGIDENFFMRLEDSFLWKEDKRIESNYTLFADKDYTDSDYYKQFPTIYHLRNYLVNTSEKADPRQIYLALHHIIKYRGNFLYPGQSFNTSEDGIEEGLKELVQVLQKYIEDYSISEIDPAEIMVYLENKQITKKEKQDEVTRLLVAQGMDRKLSAEITKAILGYNFDIAVLFNDNEVIDENGKALTTKFSDAKYEEQIEQIEGVLQDRFELIEKLHKLYSQYILNGILSGKVYISEAMLAKYDKHQIDLKLLKRLVRKYNKERYNYLFRYEKDKSGSPIKNYVNYIQGDKRCNQEELYKTIKKILENAKDEMEYDYCLKEMEEFRFLARLNTRNNNTIPWQMNQIELEKILDNQGKYYSVLNEQKDKIMKVLSFRIPYYVGPLNPSTSSERFCWIKRTKERVYPWNFFGVINEEDTAEAFITKMTNYCTYLPLEKVMPKYSLLYSKYCVLNELANMRINDKKLEPRDKQKIINDLFLHYKRITHNKFCEWLKKEQWGGCTEFEVTGYQKENEFASSLGSFIDFYRIFNKVDASNEDMIEEIIYWCTVFEEKTIVAKKIKAKYSDNVNNTQLKSILKLRYKGWSTLSKRLLTGMTIKQDEMSYNIMYYLENTKMNFMQIIKDKDLGFNKLIEQEQKDLEGKEIKVEDVQELHGSPAIKKGIWQTIKIIQEIIKCTGAEPKNIMLEFARSDEESKRSMTRKNKLLQAFERLKEDVDEYNARIINELKNNADKLNSERLFLYFIQNGKCMYTGGELKIEELSTHYQIDHIIPQCYVKDDSIENKVLVLTTENQRKLDNLLIAQEVQDKNRVWWSKLYKHGLIGAKKYNNLMRAGLSENEQKGFINRQLVETRQICKHVANLLQGSYANTNVVTVKAELGHLFREKYSLYKNRNINDFHHAHDAYLTAVIGNTLLLNKECNSSEWIYSDYVKNFKKEAMNRKQKYGYVLSMFDRNIVDEDGVVVWNGAKSLEQVMKVFEYKNCLVTRKPEEGTGAFYKESIIGRNDRIKKLIPLKEGLDIKKYGGYTEAQNAYSVVVECMNAKGKKEKRLVGIPIKISYDIKSGKCSLVDFIRDNCGDETRILKDRVLKYQLIEESGRLEYIISDKEINNAKQLYLDLRCNEVIYWINSEKYDYIKKNEDMVDEVYYKLLSKGKEQYKIFDSVWKKIEEVLVYKELDINKKCELISEILNLTQEKDGTANLKKINSNFGERVGRKAIPAKIKDTTFIDQSITGLFERRYTI